MYPASHPALDRRGLAWVLALHGAAFWGLLQMKVISLPEPLAALSVSLLQPTEATRPDPAVVPPKPRPVTRKPETMPTPPSVQLTTPESAASPSVAMAPAPTPAPPAPVAAPVAATATQPRFDADYLDNPKPAYPCTPAAAPRVSTTRPWTPCAAGNSSPPGWAASPSPPACWSPSFSH